MIYHAFDAQGGFIVGDADTGRTCYAYPSSPHARMAKRAPENVANTMAFHANVGAKGLPLVVLERFDARNWMKLAMLVL